MGKADNRDEVRHEHQEQRPEEEQGQVLRGLGMVLLMRKLRSWRFAYRRDLFEPTDFRGFNLNNFKIAKRSDRFRSLWLISWIGMQRLNHLPWLPP